MSVFSDAIEISGKMELVQFELVYSGLVGGFERRNAVTCRWKGRPGGKLMDEVLEPPHIVGIVKKASRSRMA
jgi:hypothetical protein